MYSIKNARFSLVFTLNSLSSFHINPFRLYSNCFNCDALKNLKFILFNNRGNNAFKFNAWPVLNSAHSMSPANLLPTFKHGETEKKKRNRFSLAIAF